MSGNDENISLDAFFELAEKQEEMPEERDARIQSVDMKIKEEERKMKEASEKIQKKIEKLEAEKKGIKDEVAELQKQLRQKLGQRKHYETIRTELLKNRDSLLQMLALNEHQLRMLDED